MSIYNPRQVILATSRADVEILGKKVLKDNIMTIAWHMPVSFKPFLYAISVGKTRFSCKLIKKSRVFAVNFMDANSEKAAVYCGSISGEHIDKFKEGKIEKEESSAIDCPRIRGATAYLECEVVNEVDAGDHIIFIGNVIKSEEKRTGKRLFQGEGRTFTTTK